MAKAPKGLPRRARACPGEDKHPGQGGAGEQLLQTHLSIWARLLEHPVERKRVSTSHQGKALQDPGQGPGVVFRHRLSLESQNSAQPSQTSPSPLPPPPQPLSLP